MLSTKGEINIFSFTLKEDEVEVVLRLRSVTLSFESEFVLRLRSVTLFFIDEDEVIDFPFDFEVVFSNSPFSETSNIAITSPIGTTSPLLNLCSIIRPDEVTGTSLSTLSVATSSSISPSMKESPSLTRHSMMVPSVMLSPILGILNSVLFIIMLFLCDHCGTTLNNLPQSRKGTQRV